MEKEREQHVYLARLAEQAERYDGTVRFLLLLNSNSQIFFADLS